jgi:hypothetical protein
MLLWLEIVKQLGLQFPLWLVALLYNHLSSYLRRMVAPIAAGNEPLSSILVQQNVCTLYV